MLPLSATTISPDDVRVGKSPLRLFDAKPSVSASFRHGITMDTSRGDGSRLQRTAVTSTSGHDAIIGYSGRLHGPAFRIQSGTPDWPPRALRRAERFETIGLFDPRANPLPVVLAELRGSVLAEGLGQITIAAGLPSWRSARTSASLSPFRYPGR